MAIIRLHTKKEDDERFDVEHINHDGSVISWCLKNIEVGENFKVYEGEICEQNEITSNKDRITKADNVDIFILPSGAITAAYLLGAVVLAVALTPDIPDASVNKQQQSPNNELGDRNNSVRINQRIPDICGKVKSIPDIIQREFSEYVSNIDTRVGYYCVGRNQVLIEDLKEKDTLFSALSSYSAGVYNPYHSPNNAQPAKQIGEPINELVKGVYESQDANNQVIKSPNSGSLDLKGGEVKIAKAGFIEDLSGGFIFTEYYEVGDKVDLIDFYGRGAGATIIPVGIDTHVVTDVTETRLTFDISNDSTWSLIRDLDSLYYNDSINPLISKIESKIVGMFDITSKKVNELIVNVYAINGMYKEKSSGKSRASVEYNIYYQYLDDNGEAPIGPALSVRETISGIDADEKGKTTKINLNSETYVRWWIERITPTDYEFDGNVVDEIKLKSVFGRWDLNVDHFGNVTTIQTRRTNESSQSTISSPSFNCIATELVHKYLGNGVFDTELTPNTQAIQSLIRLALDPYVGRREASELDLDNLLAVQSEIEGYFESDSAGQFSYTFDSSKLSAQDTFNTIAKAVYCALWREGRVLKALFEKPQSIPAMVFTHRSKQPNSEKWKRTLSSSDKKDSIEFTYTDENTYEQETLYFPEDKSGTNPLKLEYKGVKGYNQAYWHMMRQYNKLIYQNVDCEFSSTREGMFVKPQRMISVVKGSRIQTFDGEIVGTNGLLYQLSQEVEFTQNDDHYIILKNRDGSTESVLCTETDNKFVVQLLLPPTNAPYTGNSALKTEFSFGSESRLKGQMMIPQSIAPNDGEYVSIKCINYSDNYYKNDSSKQKTGSFDAGFNNDFK